MKILLLDDSVSTTALIKKSIAWDLLHIDEVFTAEDPFTAEELLTHEHVDIILCDIEMPGMNGLDFMRKQRALGNNAICLFLTAYAEFEYAKQAIEVNGTDYILKPFSLDDLTEKIRSACQTAARLSRDSDYIKYGRIWLENQNKLPEGDRNKLLSSDEEKENTGIQKVKNYIKDHYTEKITLNELAQVVGYNPSYLSTLFKKKEGISPLDYLNTIRINQAKLFLAGSDFSISDIAMMVGFNSVSYFNHMYKAEVGLTPGEYRAQKAGKGSDI